MAENTDRQRQDEAFINYRARILDPRRTFMISTDFMRLLGPTRGLLLSLLRDEMGKQDQEWFPLSSKRILQRIRLTGRSLNYHLDKLREAGFLNWRLRGRPLTRVFRIDFDALHAAISAQISLDPDLTED